MFTLQQIHDAHAKVKSGADFPQYIQDLMQLGVKSYTTFVYDGHGEYQGSDDFIITSSAKYEPLIINTHIDKEGFIANLKLHQQGQTDYMTFCQHAAQAGIVKWIMDLEMMDCIYCDSMDNYILIEKIPTI